MENIAQTIKLYRKAAGLSQKALAELAGVGKTTVFDLEKGKLTVQMDSLLKVLTALNIKIEFIGPFPLQDKS